MRMPPPRLRTKPPDNLERSDLLNRLMATPRPQPMAYDDEDNMQPTPLNPMGLAPDEQTMRPPALRGRTGLSNIAAMMRSRSRRAKTTQAHRK